MKREFFYRSIFAVVMLFTTAGLFAQTPIPGWDNGAGGDNYDNTAATYVTVGKTIPLYARPDQYFHPSYDPETGNGITTGFTWNWSVDNGNVTLGGGADNYIEVTGVTAGTSIVSVYEEGPYCSDATDEDITINVVAEPSVAYSAGINATYEDCQGAATFPGAISVVISGGYNAFRLAWNLEIKTLTALGADDDFYDTDKTTVLAPNGLAEEYDEDGPQSVAASPHTITSVSGGFTTINNQTTVYTYTLQGLNDQASRWGDFLALAAGSGVNGAAAGDFVYYDTADDVVEITVHPTPETGPIFHIDAGWAN